MEEDDEGGDDDENTSDEGSGDGSGDEDSDGEGSGNGSDNGAEEDGGESVFSGHGTICRATDVSYSLASISSGAGACISIYNMEDEAMPEEFRKELNQLKVGHRTDDNKFDGESTIMSMTNEQWKEMKPKLTTRVCGPAEQAKEETDRRSMAFIHMGNIFDIKLVDDDKKNGFGVILDNGRELEPLILNTFNITLTLLTVFGLVVFLVYGLFSEFAVIRKLDMIAEAAYGALVEGEEEEYEDYYTGSRNAHPEKRRDRGKNELITMATLAAQTVEKNGRELEKKQDLLCLEKMQSSLIADQIRLLELYSGRHGEELMPVFLNKKKKARVKTDKERVFYSPAGELSADVFTFDRVINDPFAIELFKHFAVTNPETHEISYPAEKPLLFLLSTLFYRSMADVACTNARVDCIRGIIEEFFGVQASLGVVTKNSEQKNELGMSDAARTTLLANAKKCIASRRPTKSLFDESSASVREHLENDVFPLFQKSSAFCIARSLMLQKAKLHENAATIETKYSDDSVSNAVDQKKLLKELNNASSGEYLSHSALLFFNGL